LNIKRASHTSFGRFRAISSKGYVRSSRAVSKGSSYHEVMLIPFSIYRAKFSGLLSIMIVFDKLLPTLVISFK